MAAKRCVVVDCEKRARTRGWCDMHYTRWLRYGSTDTILRPLKYGNDVTCAVEGCSLRPYALSYCKNHWAQWRKHGDPLVRGKGGPPRLAEPAYDGIHARLARDRGKASALLCVDCGSQASDWSVSWRRVEAGNRRVATGKRTGSPYSLNLLDFDPRCTIHAKHYDRDFNLAHWLVHQPDDSIAV